MSVKQTKKNKSKESFKVSTRVKQGLDKYTNKILFPDKLNKANKLLKGVKLP
jgi:hypothetical protein